MKPLSKINLLLLLLCTGLGAAAYDQFSRPAPGLPEAEPLAQTRGSEAAPAVAQPFRMPPKALFVEFVERPPFSASRKPPKETPKTAEKRAKPLRDLRLNLIGVVIAPDKSIAVLTKRGASEAQRVSRGEKIEGWLLEGVMPDRVILTQGKEIVELELKDAKGKRTSRRSARRKAARASNGGSAAKRNTGNDGEEDDRARRAAADPDQKD